MGRIAVAALVVLVDTALYAAADPAGSSPLAVAAYGLAAGVVVALALRSPTAGAAAALVPTTVGGAGWVLLLWTAFQVGRTLPTRRAVTVIAAVGLVDGAAAIAGGVVTAARVPNLAAELVVFVMLPFLVGRYLAQHERLVATLRQLAEQERLQERLRIARDMHDSLGHRLSLVSIQAAALEVSTLPPAHGRAVRQLAAAARDAATELHDLLGTLRAPRDTDRPPPGTDAVAHLVDGFRAAGVPVSLSLRSHREPSVLPPAAAWAAYRIVEEGLTNAARHAPGEPVSVTVDWDRDELAITLSNPLAGPPDDEGAAGGHGLAGLDERVRAAGGRLDHRRRAGAFCLTATLPVAPQEPAGRPVPVRTLALGAATAALLFVVLPVSMIGGLR